jgi:hypothetical protein
MIVGRAAPRGFVATPSGLLLPASAVAADQLPVVGPPAVAAVASVQTPAQLIATGWQWGKAANAVHSNVSGTERISSVPNGMGGSYTAAQAVDVNKPAYNATGLLSKPSAGFVRARPDSLTFTALPSQTYTAWFVLSVTAHSSGQRILASNTGTAHHLQFDASERPQISTATAFNHTGAFSGVPCLVRYSWRSTDLLARIAVNATAEQTATLTSSVAPIFNMLGGATAPITMELAEWFVAPGEFTDASAEVPLMRTYFLSEYPGLF